MTISLRRRPMTAKLALVAAAVATATLLTPAVSASASTVTTSIGTVPRGQTVHSWWNNAKSDTYQIGLIGTATGSGGHCTPSVERTWYVRQASGEKEFHYVVRGDSLRDCDVQVTLARLSASTTLLVSSVSVGSTVNVYWNGADFDNNVHLIGVLPAQPASGACELEVNPLYRKRKDSTRALVFRVTNVGSVTCNGILMVTLLPVAHTFTNGPFYPGESFSTSTLSDTPASNSVVAGVSPGQSGSGNCDWAIDPLRYWRPALVEVGATNIGGTLCTATLTWALL